MANLAFVLSFGAVFLLVLGYYYYRTPSRLQERVTAYSRTREEVGLPAAKPSYYQRRLRPYAQRLGGRLRFLKRFVQPGDWDRRLVWAGHPAGIRNSEELLGLQLLLGAAAVLLLALLATDLTGVAIMLGGGIFGMFLPLIWVDARATERQRRVNLAVPDALDILTICVQAGLGFDGALAQIVQRTSGPLSEELGRFLHELEVGVPRTECFNRLLERTNSDELRILVGALVQAQQLGVPIAQTLEEQAGDMRVRRIQRAREQGAKASPKIALITTILVAPAVMCLFLAIVIYNMVGQFSQLFSTK
jgi:tight adherence protein C